MSETPRTAASLFRDETLLQFEKLKKNAEGALAQVPDEDLFAQLDPDANSIAVLVQHMAGNLRSRWTDFLTSDGEKLDRDRDSEFLHAAGTTRADLLHRWEEGWSRLFESLRGLREEDLTRTVLIRAEPHSVIRAIHRQMTHQAYHVGQLVLLARHLAGESWKTLSVPRGGSKEFNAQMFAKG
jgi:uncharacterized damage-inducible protein DinB